MCKPIILPVVLYGCEILSLTQREEHRLRMFGNRVLGRSFRHKTKEVVGERRRLHNEELHNLCTSPNIIRVIKSRRARWAGHVARTGNMRNSHSIIVGKPEGNTVMSIWFP
jgi:hypothetical protein